MALVLEALAEVTRRPTVVGMLHELLLCCVPISAAAVVGLLVGWAWKPRWAAGLVGGEVAAADHSRASEHGETESKASTSPSVETQLTVLGEESVQSEDENLKVAVTSEDLKHLHRLVEGTDGGAAWIQMMDRSLPTMRYQAWRRDTETGAPQYRSRTIFDDVTPELVRDFFWDDEFRIKSKWDDMLIYHETLEQCLTTGTMIVRWVRKFPFFCSNREYIIGRRIWELAKSYYCVTKGLPSLSMPCRKGLRYVESYYSSWFIRPVESTRGDSQLACEVLLFHHEDMGIPREIAKLGVRQGMWGAVRKIEPGLRAYQMVRNARQPLSCFALMASVNTKVRVDVLHEMETSSDLSEVKNLQEEKPIGKSLFKFLLVGALVVAFTLDKALLNKTAIIGVARRFAKASR